MRIRAAGATWGEQVSIQMRRPISRREIDFRDGRLLGGLNFLHEWSRLREFRASTFYTRRSDWSRVASPQSGPRWLYVVGVIHESPACDSSIHPVALFPSASDDHLWNSSPREHHTNVEGWTNKRRRRKRPTAVAVDQTACRARGRKRPTEHSTNLICVLRNGQRSG